MIQIGSNPQRALHGTEYAIAERGGSVMVAWVTDSPHWLEVLVRVAVCGKPLRISPRPND